MKNCENGGDISNLEELVVSSLASTAGPACCSTRSFLASRACRRCSSSFTNSIAPPTMDA